MSLVTVRVYRPDLSEADTELVNRLQALAELELSRIRARYHDQEPSVLETALADGLTRVTAGAVDERDSPAVAGALQRGEDLTVELIAAPPATGPL
jgi:hypothetical protein